MVHDLNKEVTNVIPFEGAISGMGHNEVENQVTISTKINRNALVSDKMLLTVELGEYSTSEIEVDANFEVFKLIGNEKVLGLNRIGSNIELFIYEIRSESQVSKRNIPYEKVNRFSIVSDQYFLVNDQAFSIADLSDVEEDVSFLAKKERIEILTKEKISVWMQKGKYEKQEEYDQRVTEETTRKKYAEIRAELINDVFKEMFKKEYFLDPQKIDYDAEREMFVLHYTDFDPIPLAVPIAYAPEFEENYSNHAVNYQGSMDKDGVFGIDWLVFQTENGETYRYDSQKTPDLLLDYDELGVQYVDLATLQNTEDLSLGSVVLDEDIYDVNTNIPQTKVKNPDAIAVIIGNRNYTKTKDVDYAINDALAVKEYLINTLGYSEGNIFLLANASKGDFELYFGLKDNYKGKLFNTIKEGISDVFIYYSGHGAPSIKTGEGFFIPIEADPLYIDIAGYSLEVFYHNLAKLNARNTIVVTDACFSGATVFDNISPIGIKSKTVGNIPNGVVISSSKGTEVSSWYNDAKHGMFTYFFLKGIHSSEADLNDDSQITYRELYQYVSDQNEGVPYYARRIHGIEQSPTITGQNLDEVFVRFD
jgi:hypothetical protein